MSTFIVILVFALSVWMLVALFRRLQRQTGSGLWIVSSVLVVLGIAVGFWCAFYCEYRLGANFSIGSFPIPVAIFHLEKGQWAEFPLPKFQAWSAIVTNIIAITTIATLPVWLVLWRREKQSHRA